MATLDFGPLFRTSVGFDWARSLLDDAMQRNEEGYPPFDIEKIGEDRYRIVLAVAGFGRDDLEIVAERNQLTVRGRMANKPEADFLHHGIGARAFERKFDLANFVEVTGADLANGLLVIELKHELPDSLKPRKIDVRTVGAEQAAKPLRRAAA